MLSEGEYFALAGDNKMLIYMKGTYSEAIERIKVYFDKLSHMMALDKCHMKVTFACGVYQIRDNSENINDVINKAGSAMQTAFDIPSCITEVVHYSDKVYESVLRNHIIENDLVNAVKNNELIVEIQPKFDMKTGECVSAEALVRWMPPFSGVSFPMILSPMRKRRVSLSTLTCSCWKLSANICAAGQKADRKHRQIRKERYSAKAYHCNGT